MSQKVTSKNLSYDSALPPFLRTLHAQAGGSEPAPTIGQRRAGKKRSGSEEAEDAPLVVDEDGNVVNVEVDKDGAVKGDAQGETEESKSTGKDSEPAKAAIGGRKRKVGRVVGEAADDEEGEDVPKKKKKDQSTSDGQEETKKEGIKDKKPKKKATKIKLSFDEDEG